MPSRVIEMSLSEGMAKQHRNGGRVPAVIGTEPWSWQGDDNTGNMVHAGAARRMMSKYVEYRQRGEWTDADIERLKSEHSHIVYVTANIIRLGVAAEHPSIKELLANQVILAKNIERAGLPVVVFGLGSQSGLNGPGELTAAPQTIRLLKVISDHSHKIAVRGAFTAEACVSLGIKNVEVVGCQSMFWHRLPKFSWKLAERLTDAADEVAFNFTDALTEAKLINQALVRGHDVIGQQNDTEEKLTTQSPVHATGKADMGEATVFPMTGNAGVRLAFEKGLIDCGQYECWVKRHFFQFRNLDQWLDHMRRYCFSYGTRLHGNIAAMVAGARALWIVHDMRLKEVCDHFRLPWIELKDAQESADIHELFDRADYSACLRIYPDRYRTLFDYVDRSGLPHSLPSPIGAADVPSRGVAADYRMSA